LEGESLVPLLLFLQEALKEHLSYHLSKNADGSHGSSMGSEVLGRVLEQMSTTFPELDDAAREYRVLARNALEVCTFALALSGILNTRNASGPHPAPPPLSHLLSPHLAIFPHRFVGAW